MNILRAPGAFRTLQMLENKGNNSLEEGVVNGAGDAFSSSGFSEFMKNSLTSYGKEMISEEDLFAALVEQRLGDVSDEAAGMYAKEFEKEKASIRRGDGYINMEKAAVSALRNVVESGMIDETEGDRIYSEAFMGAQLDDNHDELWDDRGSASDPTMAVSSIEEAMMKVEMFMNGLNSGEIELVERSMIQGSTGESRVNGLGSNNTGLSETASIATSNGNIKPQSLDGGGGFLWKPVSESDKKLVVLLPEELRGMINRVEIHSSLPPSEATKLANGRFAGDTMNGNRPHFRFEKPGSSYGNDVHVVAYHNDGSMYTWDIKNGGSRND